jgi:predicted AlkP superfamily pyrophosphatase or phosphodiesterase
MISRFMHRIHRVLLIALVLFPAHVSAFATPQLVVVISLDQFRYDYLTRFREHFGRDGFRYLLDEGANFANASFKHATNMTGPGHAVILSGSYANQNGIIANRWYDITARKDVYCVSDDNVTIVGAAGAGMSPANFIGSTFGDVLKQSNNFRSRVISISNKDRAAVLLGGKLADGVYWMVDSSFITSSYYRNDLPEWVQRFNGAGLINSYFGKTWDRILPPDAYAGMDRDDAPYEADQNGLGRTFPHPIRGNDSTRITSSYYYALLTSPFGSEALLAFAKAALEGENLGKRGVPDVLCIGFSSNDYVGHAFGPHSHEVLDMTIRTDRILAELFTYLDRRVGLSNCIIVLTSDHGVAPIPEYLTTKHEHAEAGRVVTKDMMEHCNSVLAKAFGAAKKGSTWIERVTGGNVYLTRDVLREKKLDVNNVAALLADEIMAYPGVALALSRQQLLLLTPTSTVERRMKKSFHRARSGDIVYALKPYFIDGYNQFGTTHGEPYDYDAHVPVIITGRGIRSGTYHAEASPADIGPTLSALLGIEFPAGREGRVLMEALR